MHTPDLLEQFKETNMNYSQGPLTCNSLAWLRKRKLALSPQPISCLSALPSSMHLCCTRASLWPLSHFSASELLLILQGPAHRFLLRILSWLTILQAEQSLSSSVLPRRWHLIFLNTSLSHCNVTTCVTLNLELYYIIATYLSTL